MIDFIFYLAAFFIVIAAVNTVLNPNPVYGGLGLVGGFFMLGIIYILMRAEFFGVIQIMIYAGAILVLFLFMIMLLNLTKSMDKIHFKFFFAAVAIVSFIMFKIISALVFYAQSEDSAEKLHLFENETGTVKYFSLYLFEHYLPVIYFIGVLLVLAIVGAVVLTKKNYNPKQLNE